MDSYMVGQQRVANVELSKNVGMCAGLAISLFSGAKVVIFFETTK